MARGKFIVIEGLDGSGISTQTEFLRTWCQGHGVDVAVTKEPTDGPAGAIVKWILRGELNGFPEDALALLFAADRKHHLAEDIVPKLEKGTTVISDRYMLSSFAYQSVAVHDLAWLRDINAKAVVPDLTIFLDVPAQSCMERMTSDAWRGFDKLQLYEKLDTLEKVYENFHSIIPVLKKEGQNIVIVDGAEDITQVGQAIESAVRTVLKGAGSSKEASSDSESGQIAAILRRRALPTS